MAYQVPSDPEVGEHRSFGSSFLNAVFAEFAQARIVSFTHSFSRKCFGDGDELHVFRPAARALARSSDALLDSLHVVVNVSHPDRAAHDRRAAILPSGQG